MVPGSSRMHAGMLFENMVVAWLLLLDVCADSCKGVLAGVYCSCLSCGWELVRRAGALQRLLSMMPSVTRTAQHRTEHAGVVVCLCSLE